MNISVIGLGMVSKVGDQADLERLLTQKSSIHPSMISTRAPLPIDIPDNDYISPQLIRRMSHFAKISLLSAYLAFKDSNLDFKGKSVGIIQGSVYGPIISGIQSFDDLIDYGDNQLSPTHFSGSVFNTSATYLSLAFGVQGPTLTHTSGQDTLYNSLLTAAQWLESKTVDYVLMGIGDEYTHYFDVTTGDGAQPNSLMPTCEGWTSFVLSKTESAKYGQIEFGSLETLPEAKSQKHIYSVWHEQIKVNDFLNHAQENLACFPVFLRGSYPSAAAFDLALALICAKKERFPTLNIAAGIYQIQDFPKDEKIRCYNLSENNGVFYYEVS